MGTVVADEKQVLADELSAARALVERSRYEESLDLVAEVTEGAEALGDVEALHGAEALARGVWLQSPPASDATHRSGRLLLKLREDLIGLEGRPEAGTIPWWVPDLVYGLWTLLVAAGWVVFSELSHSQAWFSNSWYAQTPPVGRGDGYVMILLPAVVVWGVGFWALSAWMARWRRSVRTHRGRPRALSRSRV